MDTHHFERFMQAYQNMVFTTSVRLLGNESDAQDVSQEVFLKAYHRFDDLKDNPSAGGWLKTVATNLCLNHLSRYRARWGFFSEMFSRGEDEDNDFLEQLPAPEDLPLDGEQKALLQRALQALPAAQRVPLVLYHFEEMSYEEVAAKLNTSLSKVKTDIHRGRAALRRKLTLKSSGEPEARLGSGLAPTAFRSTKTLLAGPNA